MSHYIGGWAASWWRRNHAAMQDAEKQAKS